MDKKFLDPAACYYVYGQPPPALQGHSGYWADRRVWDVIDKVAAGLLGESAAPGNGARTSTTSTTIQAGQLPVLAVTPDGDDGNA